jgi:hypothetical protein
MRSHDVLWVPRGEDPSPYLANKAAEGWVVSDSQPRPTAQMRDGEHFDVYNLVRA